MCSLHNSAHAILIRMISHLLHIIMNNSVFKKKQILRRKKIAVVQLDIRTDHEKTIF